VAAASRTVRRILDSRFRGNDGAGVESAGSGATLDQEINASPTEALECVLCRSDGEAVAINLDIAPVEKPETVLWIDPTHPNGGV
jgi:hypothetical protein